MAGVLWADSPYGFFTFVLNPSPVIRSNGNLQFYGALLDDAQ